MAQDNYLERLFSSSTPEGKRMRVLTDAPTCVCETLLSVSLKFYGNCLLAAVMDSYKASAERLAMTVLPEMPMRRLQAHCLDWGSQLNCVLIEAPMKRCGH